MKILPVILLSWRIRLWVRMLQKEFLHRQLGHFRGIWELRWEESWDISNQRNMWGREGSRGAWFKGLVFHLDKKIGSARMYTLEKYILIEHEVTPLIQTLFGVTRFNWAETANKEIAKKYQVAGILSRWCHVLMTHTHTRAPPCSLSSLFVLHLGVKQKAIIKARTSFSFWLK